MVNLAQESLSKQIQPKRMSSIACSQALSEGYLEHVIAGLKKQNLINSVKGPGGGYFLNNNPNLITLGLILDSIGEQIKITRCENDDQGCLSEGHRCATHNLWNDIGNYVRHYLDNVSIGDIVNDNIKFNYDNQIDYIYADHNATTPVSSKVKKQLNTFMALDFHNPSSVHKLGQKTKKIIEDAREVVTKTLNASDHKVVFTSSGTEANNLVMKGIHNYKHVISAIEHPSILNSAVNPKIIPVDNNGIVCLSELSAVLQKYAGEKILLSVMMANNETGVIQPIKEIVKIAHKFGAVVHTDAVQACGKIPIDVTDLGVDLLTISSHKLGSIAGSGALLFNPKAIKINPIINGGGQEKGLRAGTENVMAIYGLAVALSDLETSIRKMNSVKSLRDKLESEITSLCPQAIIFSSKVERLPNTSCIYMPNVSNEIQLIGFDLDNIAVSSGSACSSGKIDSSHVLAAMEIDDVHSKCSIRVSLGSDITEENIEKIVNCWYNIYQKSLNIGEVI